MKKACIKMIRLYQKYISPWKRYGHCKYYPTCSNYAIEAYQKYGFFKGTALTAVSYTHLTLPTKRIV